jgi:hypothetical protein
MQIEWAGRTWDFDATEVTLKQAFVIKDSTKDDVYPAGRSLAAWNRGLNDAEPSCIRAAYWLMLQQAGQQVPVADLEFNPIKFNNVLVEATVAEQKQQAAAKKAEEEAAAAAAVPTSAPSPGPGSPPDMTLPPLPGSGAAG